MKLSAYHKEIGNDVELITDYKNLFSKYHIVKDDVEVLENLVFMETSTIKYNDEDSKRKSKKEIRWYCSDDIIYDKILISKVFTDTPIFDRLLELDIVEYGGTGFFYDKAPPLLKEIEHHMPDYFLYDNWVKDKLAEGVKPKELEYYTDYSIGFTTRGCIRQCSFCVNKNYKQCDLHSTVEEFLDKSRKFICVLDDNILACKDWKLIFESLQATGKRFQFKQGCDERLLTDEKCEVLFNQSRWIGDYIFAFDNIKDAELIERKLQLIRKHTDKVLKFYTFCAFNHNYPDQYDEEFWVNDIVDLFERIKILMKYKCLPYIMRYKDYVKSPYYGIYTNIAGWCNQPSFFKKKSLREYCYAEQKRRKYECASVRYLKEFENKYPDIVEKYFDIKYEEQNVIHRNIA